MYMLFKYFMLDSVDQIAKRVDRSETKIISKNSEKKN